jgi:hypothetical protein
MDLEPHMQVVQPPSHLLPIQRCTHNGIPQLHITQIVAQVLHHLQRQQPKGTAANTTLAAQGTLTKSGSNFSGWNTSADGTGTNYAAGLTTYASPGNITLYAQWTTPTGTPSLASGSDLGSSSTDKITSDNTPTINVGSVVSGARVVITATSATGTTYTCTVESATASSACTFGTMEDGTYSFTVTQTYNGATSSASTALTNVVIDATAPTLC